MKHPRFEDEMSVIESNARYMARALEERESRRTGLPIPAARKSIARRLNVSPGSLENIARQRLKGVRAWLYEKIRDEFLRDVEGEIGRLQHELDIARLGHIDLGADQAREIETHLAALRDMAARHAGARKGGRMNPTEAISRRRAWP
jgi:hypothetical protein